MKQNDKDQKIKDGINSTVDNVSKEYDKCNKQFALILANYALAAVLLYLPNIYTFSTERLMYVFLLIGHILLLIATYKTIRNNSITVKLITIPLALWAFLVVLVSLMFSIAPFLRYQ